MVTILNTDIKGLGSSSALIVCLLARLESGNSIEEKLLKNGTKDLIREVAAQGTDYTLAFLTQVRGFPLYTCSFYIPLQQRLDYMVADLLMLVSSGQSRICLRWREAQGRRWRSLWFFTRSPQPLKPSLREWLGPISRLSTA